MLIDDLRAALTAAIRDRDETRKAALRLGLGAVTAAEKAGKTAVVLDDAGVQKVLGAEIRKLTEAADIFEGAGRLEKAADDRAQAAVLSEFVPEAMPTAELRALVADVLAAEGLSGPQAMGPAMKAVTAAVAGRADGRTVSAIVRELLAG